MPNENPIVKKTFVKRENPQDPFRIYNVLNFWNKKEIEIAHKIISGKGVFKKTSSSGSENLDKKIADSEYGFKNFCLQDNPVDSVRKQIDKLSNDMIKWAEKVDMKLEVFYTIGNWFFYGDYSTAHVDSKSADYTGIAYINPVWNFNHGSGTLIFEDNPQYLAYCAFPTPGSFVLFPSNMYHKAVPPEKMNNEGRLSITFQFKLRE